MCVGMLRHNDEKLRHCTGLRRVSCCSCRSGCRNAPTRYWTPTVCVTWVGGYVGVSDGYSDIALHSDALEVTEHRRVHRRFRWTLRHSSVLRRWCIGGSGRSLRCRSFRGSDPTVGLAVGKFRRIVGILRCVTDSLQRPDFQICLGKESSSQRPFFLEEPI